MMGMGSSSSEGDVSDEDEGSGGMTLHPKLDSI